MCRRSHPSCLGLVYHANALVYLYRDGQWHGSVGDHATGPGLPRASHGWEDDMHVRPLQILHRGSAIVGATGVPIATPASLRSAARGLVAGLLCALLAGCTANAPSTPEVGLGTPITTGSTDPNAGTPPLPGTRGAVRIALLLPLTGSAGTAEVAKGLRQAGELALVEFDNPNIVMTTKDTRGTADGARLAAEEAVKGGAEIILGPVFAKEVAAVSPVARAAKVPVLAFSSDRSVAGNGTYLLSFLAGQDVPRVVDFAAAKGKRTWAALIPEGVYGKVLDTAFREAVQATGGRVVAMQTFPANANGMLDPIRKVKAAIDESAKAGAPVDALFVPAGQDTLPALAPLLPYNDIDAKTIKLVGSTDWDYASVGREDVLQGGWFPAPDPKGWTEFAQRYQQSYNSPPPRLASVAYDAVSLAVSLSGGAPGQRFSEANLTRNTGFAGIDGLFRLRPNGAQERGLAVLEVQKFGATVIDAAPAAFPAGAAAAQTAGSGSTGGLSTYLPRLNLLD